MTHSVVCNRKVGLDVGIIQQQLHDFGVEARVHPIGETFCFIFFSDKDSKVVFLRTRLLEKWFSEVREWEESDFVDGLIRWVGMKGVLTLLWHNQFFSFVVFGNSWRLRRRLRRRLTCRRLG